jgi:asparagine synthase (glutamine-hydrolysing)
MCGIAGFLLKSPADEQALRAMTETLAHRGPDGEGFFAEGGAGLGHRRLAVLDLSTGAQPLFNEDRTVVVVYNGEIYNYRTLREELRARGHRFATATDTEVLVHGYEEWGEDFAARLEGIFAFALYDRPRRRLLLYRDPVGVKPLYVAAVPGGVLFASEPRALRRHPLCPTGLDLRAVGLFLALEYLPGPATFTPGIGKLRPGHLLRCQEGGVEERPYWRWLPLPAPPKNFGEAVEAVRAEVLRAVKDQTVADVPLGVFLSGGVDSSVVTAALCAAGGRVESFSIAFEDPSFDESAHARRAAAHLGTAHHEHLFSERELLDEVPRLLGHLDEPFADPSVFPTALLSRFTRGRVTVALGGDGGDELFAGYPTYWVHRAYPLYRALPGPLRRGGLSWLDRLLPVSHANLTLPYRIRKFRDGAERPMPSRHLHWMGAWTPEGLRRLFREDPGPLPYPEPPPAPAEDPATAAQWLDFHTYLAEDILYKVDRASMAFSLEARVPLLDPAVVRLAFSLPPSWKLSGAKGKRVLKAAFARDLPPGHLDRPKKGFGIPLARWLCGPLRPLAEELLSDAVLGRVPFLDPREPRRLWREHLEKRADHRKPLWALLCFLDGWRRNPSWA